MSFFAFLQDRDSFSIKDYIYSLSDNERLRWSKGGLLPNTLMTIYQKKVIDIEEFLKTKGEMFVEPMGEFDLLWILKNFPKNYLNMKQIIFTTSDKPFEFTVKDGEASARIEMTDYFVEVKR